MKYCIRTTNGTLPISEDEVPKVIQAMDKKGIVVLQVGIVNGAFISEIVRDIHAEKGYNYGYKFQAEDHVSRNDYLTDIKEVVERLQGNSTVLIGSIKNK